jgi:hypothetical protein
MGSLEGTAERLASGAVKRLGAATCRLCGRDSSEPDRSTLNH